MHRALKIRSFTRPMAGQGAPVSVGRGWRWWIPVGSPVIESRVFSGEPLALIGDSRDGLAAWARAIDPRRAVFDLQGARRSPTLGQVRRAFGAEPSPIVIANQAERVTRALGMEIQPYFAWTSPLSGRPGGAIALLEGAMSEWAGRPVGLADLGWRGDALRACPWRGLGEIRHTARLLAALVVEGNNVSRAAIRLVMSRQAFHRYLAKRMVRAAAGERP